MDNELLLNAYKAVASGKSCAFATIVESSDKGSPRKTGSKMIVFQDGSFYGTIGGGWSEEEAKKTCLKAIKKKKPSLETFAFHSNAKSYCGGEVKVFIEPLSGVRNFILCGAGHIGLPLSFQVKLLNFHLTVLDDRPEYANKKRFPHADKILIGNPSRILKKLTIKPNDYIMIVTHAHKHDFNCLKAVIKSKAAYIGVISSQTKKMKMINDLSEKGISPKDIQRMRVPAGIDIGAQTPEEIALSIAAELVALENKEYIGSKKFKAKK